MSNTHTPGPWVAQQYNERMTEVLGPSGEHIVNTFGDSRNANARLIAAAPDLLDALIDLAAEAEAGGWGEGQGVLQRSLDAARAAIRVARGEG